MMDEDAKRECNQCEYSKNYGARSINEFGGVKLCDRCRDEWRQYHETLPERAANAFPQLGAKVVRDCT